MKPILLVCCMLSGFLSHAQTPLSNGGLESWHVGSYGDEPDSFEVGQYAGLVAKTTTAHSGQFAASLKPKDYSPFPIFDGMLRSGQAIQTPAYAVSFWYQYRPEGHDSGIAFVNMYSNYVGGFFIGYGEVLLDSATTSWRRAVIPIQYYWGMRPQDAKSIFITFRTGDSAGHTHPGTELLIDDIEILLPAEVPSVRLNELVIYPNPCAAVVNISLPPGKFCDVVIVNAGGQIISERKAVAGNQEITCADWQPGIYFARIVSSDHACFVRFVVRE